MTDTDEGGRKFAKLEGCEFLDTAYVDGDSFRMRWGSEEHVFRLYDVGAPESDTRFPERNAEQAAQPGITPTRGVNGVGKGRKN